ncbi:MAG: sigma-70 family RNA polymerase sigma factor [Bacteroidota bacterium]
MYSKNYIILLLQRQDQRVMQSLYDNYAPALYGVILRIVRSEALAEDVLQDTFVKIWKYGPAYDPSKGSLFTWMLNIARNTAIDAIRSAHHRHQHDCRPVEQAPETSVQPNINHIGLDNIVENLEDKYRRVIDLIYFQGYTQKEVGEELNIPLGTVKSRVRIALRELRKFFTSKLVSLLLYAPLLLKLLVSLG